MKKKLLMIVLALTMSVTTFAQFEQGKKYASASLSGLDLNYNSDQDWHLGLSLKGGYMFESSWMMTGQFEYDYQQHGANYFAMGAGLRYYIEQNGLYLGAGANYVHHSAASGHKVDDFMPSIQLGYAFFLSSTLTIEPELYYNQSLNDHSSYSGFGLRIGFGIYL